MTTAKIGALSLLLVLLSCAEAVSETFVIEVPVPDPQCVPTWTRFDVAFGGYLAEITEIRVRAVGTGGGWGIRMQRGVAVAVRLV